MSGAVQAFANAVEEEVAFAAVTNYEVTLFIMRPQNARDKTIFVSDPVWCTQTRPSANACWLNFMLQAQRSHPGTFDAALACAPPAEASANDCEICVGRQHRLCLGYLAKRSRHHAPRLSAERRDLHNAAPS